MRKGSRDHHRISVLHELQGPGQRTAFERPSIQTIATETGAQVLILDGIHGRVGVDAGLSYFQIMYQDLKELRIGLEVTS